MTFPAADKGMDDTTADAMLDKIATATRLTVCSQIGGVGPADYADIDVLTHLLGSYTITAGDGNGDFTITDGDTSGRKLTVAAQSGNQADETGTGQYICLDDGSTLLYQTTTPAKSLNSGQSFDVASWSIEVRDPT